MICGVTGFAVTAQVYGAMAVPVYDLARDNGPQAIRQVVVAATEFRWPLCVVGAEAIGRAYKALSHNNLLAIPDYSGGGGRRTMLEVCNLCYFDLWTAAKALKLKRGLSLALTFDLDIVKTERIYLVVGCYDSAVIYVNGRAIWGTICSGVRIFVPDRDIVPVNLRAGRNSVTLVLKKASRWTAIPKHHFCSDWMCSVTVVRTEAEAWHLHLQHAFHLTDTPLLTSLDQVHIDGQTSGQLYCYLPHQARPIRGSVRWDGSVAWAGDVSDIKGIAMLLYQGLAEPIYLAARPLAATIDQDKDFSLGQDFWSLRIRHLLGTQFVKNRDVWWSRKLVLGIFDKCRGLFPSAVIEACRLAQFGVISYPSPIDHKIQYALYWRPSTSRAVTWLVIPPFVPNPLRRPVDSVVAANLCADEDVACSACPDSAVLWPMYVDLDHGRNLAQIELKAAFKATLRHFPEDHEVHDFVFGCCSAGVVALRFAADNGAISGVVLYSPVVDPSPDLQFTLSRDETVLRDFYPPPVRSAESLLSALARKHFYVVYDSGIPGHGDLPATKRLVAELHRRNVDVTARWLPLRDEYMWGYRLQHRYEQCFEWIAKARLLPYNRAPYPIDLNRDNGTIRSALLQGFTVEDCSNRLLHAWREQWLARMAEYRGSQSAGDGRSFAVVIFRRANVVGLPIFRITREPDSHGAATVAVTYSGAKVQAPLPKLDLLASASFASVRWVFCNGRWNLDHVSQ